MLSDKGLMAGSSTLLILSLIKEDDMYGYRITEELKQRSDNKFNLKAGTLYPILHSLEKDGLVTSYEKPANGKLRKYYSITEKGVEALEARQKSWTDFTNAVLKVIGGEIN